MLIHRVRDDECLTEIAQSYEVSPIKLAENNGIAHSARLIPGEELLVLTPTRMTNVRAGDTFKTVAGRFGVNEEMLLGLNPELCGKGSVYEGQPLAIRYGTPSWGMGIGNGYYYRGCSVSRLISAFPYLSYVTVAAGVARSGIAMLFDDKEIVSLSRSAGKIPLFRIYAGEISDYNEWCELIKALALLAKTRNYGGITLAGVKAESPMRLAEWTVEAKKILFECDLKLFYEIDAEDNAAHVDYADGGILLYDKIHKEKIPSFEEGEGEVYRSFAENHDSLRTFIDLSPFALVGGKYITKSEAREAVLRARGRMLQNDECGCTVGITGSGKRERHFIYENMKNTKEKLELVSSAGYYGISFDIARVPIYELMMFRVMFSRGIGGT